jgi:hypothetical protein
VAAVQYSFGMIFCILPVCSSTEMAAIFVNMEYFTEPSCKGKLLQQLAHVQEQLNI